jgi:hypothetical protein
MGDANERWQRTAIAAFYRAEARGFAPGRELDDWLAAERELEAQEAESVPLPARAEPIAQVRATPSKRPAAKGVGRGRKLERSVGSNIGGMA